MMVNQKTVQVKFDANNLHWVSNNDYNLSFLMAQQNYFNDLLQTQGIVFLNEVLLVLDIPRTREGQTSGWIWSDDHETSEIEFDIDMSEIEDGIILLNFHVQEDVIDALP
jgi:hypothetical protein